MTRAAIYARYSSDNQDDRSVDDQIALCREYATRQGLKVVATFEDRAISGAAIENRPGIKQMLVAAFAGQFDVLIAESTSRISRDQGDRAGIRKRLSFCDIKIMTPADGVVTSLVDGVRAVIDSQYLVDLAAQTIRGMQSNIAEGKSAGGRAYGYAPVKGEPGKLTIVDHEAETIRSIFARFLAGTSARTIAAELNRRNVPPPRGAYWRASTLIGSKRRGHGILMNTLYAGRLVWNRVRMVKHPDRPAKRLSRVNPESEWRYADAAHLRIVDQETFDQVQALLADRSIERPRGRTRPRYLLSGLLRCGACGAGMSMRGRDRKGRRICCTQFMEADTCTNSRGYYLDGIEQAVVTGLKQRLGTRAAIAHYVRTYNDERKRSAITATNARGRIEAELNAAQKALDRLIDAHIHGRIADDEAIERLPILRAKRDRLRSALAELEEPVKVIALHPSAVDQYLKDIDRLADVINDDLSAGESEAANALRKIVHRVTVQPAPIGTLPTIEVEGRLEALLPPGVFPSRSLSRGVLVAGGGLGQFPATDVPGISFSCQAAASKRRGGHG